MATIRLSTKGQVVIPKEIRRGLRLERGATIEVKLRGQIIELRPVQTRDVSHDWRRWRGSLAGKKVLRELEAEHAREIAEDR